MAKKKDENLYSGILVIDKEPGFTSHDVVGVLRRILGMKRIGHTGTLDPNATGVLPVALGHATRLSEYLTDKKKTYEAVLRLGIETDTQDRWGNVIEEREVLCTEEEVRRAAASFVGEKMQVPPMYSALKVSGQRLYDLARQGISLERAARPVTFYEIGIRSVSLPDVALTVTCSKGTYIRTLCHDIGQALGCGAAMQELRRTASGDFTIEKSYTLSQVEQAAAEGRASSLIIPLEDVLARYPRVSCRPEGDRLLLNGNPMDVCLLDEGAFSGDGSAFPAEGRIRLCTSDGVFIGLYRYREDRGQFFPEKMFYSRDL